MEFYVDKDRNGVCGKRHMANSTTRLYNVWTLLYSDIMLRYILMEFGIIKKLIRLIKMCLTETNSRVRVGKNLSGMFPIRNGLKRRCIIAIAFQH